MFRLVFQILFIGLMSIFLVSSGKVSGMKGSVTWERGFWSDIKVNFWAFDGKVLGLRVLDEGDGAPKFGSLDQAMTKGKCIAGANGGFFGIDGKPWGLVVSSGKMLNFPANGSPLVGGVIFDDGKEICLMRTNAWLKSKDARKSAKEAIQAGPFLLEKGEIIKGLNDEKVARRTFLATNGKGGWVLGVSSPVTLKELASQLKAQKSLGNIKISSAINLDGGSSSGFWVNETIVENVKNVRNYLGVVPRPVLK